jgi:hypothetical protein
MGSFLLENQAELCEKLFHTMGAMSQDVKILAVENWRIELRREILTITGQGITRAKMTIDCIIADKVENNDWAKNMNETLAKLPSKDYQSSKCINVGSL